MFMFMFMCMWAWRSRCATMDCSRLLDSADDAVPARAPLQLFSSLARRVVGLSVVVLGSDEGSTDVHRCLAAAGAASVAAATLERSQTNCEHLRLRSRRHNNSFSVVCGDALSSIPDADVYFWQQSSWRTAGWRLWLRRAFGDLEACRNAFGGCQDEFSEERLNHIDSFDVLQMLRSLQLRQRIRASAQWAAGFDERAEGDAWTRRKLADAGWIQWGATVDEGASEQSLCLRRSALATRSYSNHICARKPTERFHLAGGTLSAAASRVSPPHCNYQIGATTAKWNASREMALIRQDGRVTQSVGLSAAMLASGEVRCGIEADHAAERIITSLQRGRRGRHSARGASSADEASPAIELANAASSADGLIMIHGHRHGAAEYAASAAVLRLSANMPMVRSSSLLLVCTNTRLPPSSLLRWLSWYDHFGAPVEARRSAEADGVMVASVNTASNSTLLANGGLRMLLHTEANIGYTCGEFYILATTARIWRRFPWVLAFSGPDVLALPGEFALLSRMLIQEAEHQRLHYMASARPELSRTALLYDKFRPHRNDPLSRVEPRFNMDLFVFFPPRWKAALPTATAAAAARAAAPNGGTTVNDDQSLWTSAVRHCVNQTRNRPEAILHIVQRENNLSVTLIGNGSRGTLDDRAKWTMEKPDALIWHSHSMSSVLRWLSSRSERRP